MSTTKTLMAGLRAIKANLMHQRRFGAEMLGAWRNSAASAEGDLEAVIVEAKKVADAHDEMLAVLKKVAAYGADQMWHLKGGNLGSHVQTLHGEIERVIAKTTGSQA